MTDPFALPARRSPPAAWHHATGSITLDRPIILGILNVTPDSFSDGGRFFSIDAAIDHARRMRDDGADVLDVGGESTRPQGAQPVSADEERRRVLPVIEGLVHALPDVPVSVDTVKAEVAPR